MTPEEAALAAVVTMLEELGVPYMVTGSVAASFHGRPRATHDTDIVIDPTREQLDELVRRFSTSGIGSLAAGVGLALYGAAFQRKTRNL